MTVENQESWISRRIRAHSIWEPDRSRARKAEEANAKFGIGRWTWGGRKGDRVIPLGRQRH